MSGDREKTAGEAALEKVKRREGLEQPAEGAEQAAAEAREGDEENQRSPQEDRLDLAAGSIEPEGVKPTEPDLDKSSEELREDVAAARDQLAGTVEELTEKLDPRPDVERAKEEARERAEAVGRAASDNAVPIAVGAGALLLLLLWFWRR